MQAVRESSANEGEPERNLQKLEKSTWQMTNGVLTYASCPRGQREMNQTETEFAEMWKKFLTNPKRYDRLKKLRDERFRPGAQRTT